MGVVKNAAAVEQNPRFVGVVGQVAFDPVTQEEELDWLDGGRSVEPAVTEGSGVEATTATGVGSGRVKRA